MRSETQTAVKSQTQTPEAQTAVARTATATFLAPFTYHTAAPGSGCDTQGGKWTYTPDDPGFGTPSITCLTGGTQLEDAQIRFNGAPAFTFPTNFTASVGVTDLQNSCVKIATHALFTEEHILDVCQSGYWTVYFQASEDVPTTPVAVTSGQVTASNSLNIAIASSSTGTQYFINSQQVYASTGTTNQANGVILEVDRPEAPRASQATFSNFSIVPQS